MMKSRFLKELVFVILLSLLGVYIVNYFLGEYAEWNLAYIGIILFSILSILIHFFGKLSLKSANKYGFIRLIMGNVMFKIIACFGVVGVYFKLYAPDNKYFLLPFLLVYLIFTIFETYFLLKQSAVKKK